MSTNSFHDPWDSGQVGWIYVTKAEIRKEFDVKQVSKRILEKTAEVLENEVQVYDCYLKGDVYGFVVYERGPHGEFEAVDSCYDFYGGSVKENGLVNQVPPEFREALLKAGYFHHGLTFLLDDAGKVIEFESPRQLRDYLEDDPSFRDDLRAYYALAGLFAA